MPPARRAFASSPRTACCPSASAWTGSTSCEKAGRPKRDRCRVHPRAPSRPADPGAADRDPGYLRLGLGERPRRLRAHWAAVLARRRRQRLGAGWSAAFIAGVAGVLPGLLVARRRPSSRARRPRSRSGSSRSRIGASIALAVIASGGGVPGLWCCATGVAHPAHAAVAVLGLRADPPRRRHGRRCLDRPHAAGRVAGRRIHLPARRVLRGRAWPGGKPAH